MKKHLWKLIRSWSPLSAWTGCISVGASGELRFSLFA
jgi:hypothetical protein